MTNDKGAEFKTLARKIVNDWGWEENSLISGELVEPITVALKEAHAAGRAEAIAEVVPVLEAAKAQVDRWYREPPVEEGGDFIAGMHELKVALERLKENK